MVKQPVINSPIIASKYLQVESLLLRQIQDKEIPHGQRIPSEPQLSESLRVSRVTVRRAVANLVRDGVLETRPGYGHVVRSTQPRRTIGVLLNHDIFEPAPTPFIPLLLQAIRTELDRRDWRMLLYGALADGPAHQIDYKRVERDIRRGRFVGLLGVSWPNFPEEYPEAAAADHRLRELLQAEKIPCSTVTDLALNASTGTDYHAVGYLGTRYFLERNVSRVGLLCWKPGVEEPTSHEVPRGYRDALNEAGIAVREEWIVRAETTDEQAGYEAFRQWWRRRDRPQALVVADDLLARGAMLAAVELGVDIPGQLQFASLAIKGGKMFFPRPFARLEMDPAEYARQVVDRLATMIDNPGDEPGLTQVRPQVIEAESNGAGG